MTNLGQLSTELVSLIVHFVDQRDLYACTLLNRTFHGVATPLLWRTLHDKNIGTFISLNDTTGVGAYIRHANFNDLTNGMFLFLMTKVPMLETLAIDSARYITDNSLRQLPQHCPHLTSIHLRQTPITPYAIKAMARHCPSVWRLDLDKCSHLQFELFGAVGRLQALQELSIQGGYLLTNSHQKAKTAAQHVIGLDRLTRLTLTGITSLFAKYLVTATAWPHLTHLCLGSGYELDESQVVAFIETHPNLVALELHMTDLGDRTLGAIATGLPHLQQLGLVRWLRITPDGIRHLIAHCLKLVHVYFGDWSHDLAYAFPEATGYCFIDLRQRRKLFQLDKLTIDIIRG